MLAGNGLQGTLIALRGADEGFSTLMIGIIGAAYFAGFIAGCFMSFRRILRAVGHIRTFSALCAIAASGTLLLVLIIDPYVWAGLRFLIGLCFASLFTTVDSWLNSGVTNENRAKVLSIYRLIDIIVVTGSQFLIPGLRRDELCHLRDPRHHDLHVAGADFTGRPVQSQTAEQLFLQPACDLDPVADRLHRLRRHWTDKRDLPHDRTGLCPDHRIAGYNAIATFMGAGILGGAVLQYPFGMLSDRYDRRIVLLIATAGAALAGMFINGVAGSDPHLNYIGIFLFGAFSLPLFSLSAAHANDHASKDQYVQVAAGLIFFWSVGAMAGPFISSALMELYGPSVLFKFTSAVHAALILVTLWRMRVRAGVPRDCPQPLPCPAADFAFLHAHGQQGGPQANATVNTGRQGKDN